MNPAISVVLLTTIGLLSGTGGDADPKNLLEDPSFEITKDKDQFGHVFARWGGWKYEGECEFRVGRAARTGKHSCLLFGGVGPKIRIAQDRELEPGRYRSTAYLRGLDIGRGSYNLATEFMFDGKYHQLNKNGTFGWTRLTYVGELKEKKQSGPSFGLMAPGYLWIDDVALEKVGEDVAPDRDPDAGERGGTDRVLRARSRRTPCDAPSADTATTRPGDVATPAAPRSGPGRRSPPAPRSRRSPTSRAAIRSPGAMWSEPTPRRGPGPLRIDGAYASLDQAQDWRGYDFLKADLYTSAKKPLDLSVEIRDAGTRDYWTRVNYTTVVPPGKSTLVITVKRLYVGEKSRPGRMLDLGRVNRLVFGIGDSPPAPLFVDDVRLERDDTPGRVRFEGLHAFDFGSGTSPVMEGFTAITPATVYSRGRGYGLKDAQVWRRSRCAPARPALSGLPLHRVGGPRGRRTQRTLSCLREYRQPLRLLGRVPGLPQEGHPRRGAAGRERDDGLRSLPEEVLPVLGRGGPTLRQHLRQVPEGVFRREAVRGRRDRRPVESRIPGGELRLLRSRPS